MQDQWPDRSPEPAAVDTGRHHDTGSAIAVHVAGPRRLSFYSLGLLAP